MRFGVQIQPRLPYPQFREAWLECEKLGFNSVWAYDHLDDCLEGWTLISSLAPLTQSIRFGVLVTCNSYRHPPLLAKMASTLDVISNGRLEFGIGAGDAPNEYEGYGYPYPENSTRIEQLKEALLVIKKIWTEERPTYKGKYYSIKEAKNEPRPIQKPHPPIWIGSLSGKRLISRVAALHANVYNVAAKSPIDFREKVETFKASCRSIGRRYDDVTKTIMVGFTIARTMRELEDKLVREAKTNGIPLDEYKKVSFNGTPETCAEIVKEYADLGVQGLIIIFPPTKQLEDLKLFSEVVQQFKRNG